VCVRVSVGRGVLRKPSPCEGREETALRPRGGAAAVAPLPPALVRTELPLLRCGVARGHRAPRTPPGRKEPASRALQTRLLTANFKDRRKSYKVSLFKCLIYKLDCYTINQKVN